jgi:hypothetical protein
MPLKVGPGPPCSVAVSADLADQESREATPHRGAGFDIVPDRPPGFAALLAQCPTGLPRDARCGLLLRLRGRPPARHRCGRSPHNQPTCNHADGATLVRWDAIASQRTRRPGMRVPWIATRGISDLKVGPGPPYVGPREHARPCKNAAQKSGTHGGVQLPSTRNAGKLWCARLARRKA